MQMLQSTSGLTVRLYLDIAVITTIMEHLDCYSLCDFGLCSRVQQTQSMKDVLWQALLLQRWPSTTFQLQSHQHKLRRLYGRRHVLQLQMWMDLPGGHPGYMHFGIGPADSFCTSLVITQRVYQVLL